MTNVMNRGVILFKKEGQVIPKDFIQHMLGTYGSVSGFIIQTNNEKGEALLEVGTSSTEENPTECVDVDNLMAMQEELKPNPAYFFFSNLPKDTPSQNFQPFVMKDDEDVPWAAFMIEGDFASHAGKEGKTEEFELFTSILKEDLETYLESVGFDLTKLHTKINAGRFEKIFEREIGHRGVCLLVIVGHDGIVMGKNELSEQFDWGWSTQTLGFGEVKEQEPVPEEKPVVKSLASRFANRAKAATPKAAEEPKKEQPKAEEKLPDGVHRVPPTSVPSVEAPLQPKEGEEIITVPDHLHSNARKAFIRQKLGIAKTTPIPFDKRVWAKKGFAFIVKKSAAPVVAKSFAEAKDQLMKKTVTDTAVKTVQDAATKVEAKTPVLNSVIKDAAASGPKSIELLSEKDAKELTTWVIEYLDSVEKTNLGPLDIQKSEGKYKKFTDETGCSWVDIYKMPTAKIFELISTKPAAAGLLFIEARARLMALDTTTVAELVNTAPAAASKPVVAVKSRFAGRGKATAA